MTRSTAQSDDFFQQGMAFVKGRDFESAAESFRRSAEADPDHGPAHSNFGSSLAALGRHEDAVSAYRQALEIDPGFAHAHFNLGASLRVLGKSAEASACFVKALEIDPRHDEAYYYLGLEHQAAGRPNEALACYLQASDLNPGEAEIYSAMASVLLRLKLPDAAIQAFEKALDLNPDDSAARANLMHRQARNCDWEGLAANQDRIEELGVVGNPIPPFTLLAFEDHPGRHRIRSERFAQTSYAMAQPLPVAARPRTRPERLRVGYFSADFHDHATMHLAARLFELHDRDRFETFAYSYGPEHTGPFHERARRSFDQFRDVEALNAHEIADMARADGLDIAVDLKGYTEHQRLGIFARRPAPIQITYLGYPGTLAAPFIDYLIADPTVIPAKQRHAYSEQVIYLPNSYQINDNTRPSAAAAGSRSDAGLPADGFVFCCFNNSYKISPAEFEIWMELLRQVDGSALWLLASQGKMQTNLTAQCERGGVDPARLIFAPRTELKAHLDRLHLADLFLDTFNYNAHTTASDSLWAGVPLITKAGDGFAARVAASLLHAIGLSELVTTSPSDYADLALQLATDPARLAAIREKLAVNRSTMPLFDSELMTRHIEAGFDLAYQRYLDGKEPADLMIPA
jgi:protein O-GlcNAc transferase